jgi:O-antigen/teichoic acid export membrane protein
MKEKFIISIFSQIVSNIIYFFAFYLLFLNLDKSLIGIWTFLSSIINLGFLFINIGLDTIHYQYSGKKNSSEYFGTFFTIKMILLLINVLTTFILLYFVSNSELWSNGYGILIFFLLSSKILVNVANIFFINLRTKIKVFKTEIPFFLTIIGKSSAIVYLSINISYILNPLLFLCVSNFIFDSIFLLLIIIFSKHEFTLSKPRKELAISYLKDIRPLFLFSITLVVSTYLGNIILDYSYGHESLGNFTLINDYIIPALLIFSTSIITVYLTLFSKYFENGNIKSIEKITHILEKYSSILFLSITLTVLLNGDLIFNLFLPEYIESVPILYILVFIPYLIGISAPYSYHFIAGKKQKINAYINSFIRIIIIVLMVYLIPKNFLFFSTLGLGMIGYALSLTCPWILWGILNRYYSHKKFNIKYQIKIFSHILFAFTSFLVTFGLKTLLLIYFTQNIMILIILNTFISLIIFFGMLFIFKELNREDLKFLSQLFKFQTYKKSLKDEFLT